MKKVYVSRQTEMILNSMDNINKNHKLYNSFYEKEVEDDFHVNVCDNAKVYGNAIVFGNARVCDNAIVYDNAIVFGNAIVYGKAMVYGNARVYGDAIVYGKAMVYGNARVFGDARITTNIIHLIGLPYNITITDNHISIGCKQFTFETAKKLAKRNIDTNEYKRMIIYKDLLLELIKTKEDIGNENIKR